jgi:hypothetical protein
MDQNRRCGTPAPEPSRSSRRVLGAPADVQHAKPDQEMQDGGRGDRGQQYVPHGLSLDLNPADGDGRRSPPGP